MSPEQVKGQSPTASFQNRPKNRNRMFKTFTAFCKFFKSLILQSLWIYNFCDFTRYWVFWL